MTDILDITGFDEHGAELWDESFAYPAREWITTADMCSNPVWANLRDTLSAEQMTRLMTTLFGGKGER